MPADPPALSDGDEPVLPDVLTPLANETAARCRTAAFADVPVTDTENATRTPPATDALPPLSVPPLPLLRHLSDTDPPDPAFELAPPATVVAPPSSRLRCCCQRSL